MPTLRYYDGAAYQPLPGMPGPTGPVGPAGPTGAQGPPAPGVSQNYVAVAWLGATTTASQVMSLTATGLIAGHSYLVTGYAIAFNTSAAAATARVCITTQAANGVPGPNAGVWVFYEANIAADQSGVGAYSKGTTGSFIYTPAVTGDVTFVMYNTSTAGTMTFSANNAAIFVVDMTGTQGPIGATGPSGPTGPAGLSGTIVSVRATRVAAYTAPTTAAILTWDTKGWDTQNAYNTSTGLFTAPVAGKYKIESQIGASIAASGGYLTLAIYKNGVAYGARSFSQYTSAASQWSFAQVIDTVDLAVGDTISMYASAFAATTLNAGSDLTYFTIDLLSGSGPQGVTGPTGPTGPPYAAGQMYSLVYYQTIPAPTVAGSPVTVTHNLGTTFPMVQLYDSVTLEQIVGQVRVSDANHVQISVAQNMPNPVNIVIMGVAASPVPINPGDAANKSYVDSWRLSASYATTAPLPAYTSGAGGVLTATANGQLVVDGVNASPPGRVLYKSDSNAGVNVLYTVTQAGSASTPWVLTPVAVQSTQDMTRCYVFGGNQNQGTEWILAAGTWTPVSSTANLPPRVTSGSGVQSFTDILGDVWVAANGVNNGNWRRARDVLKNRVWRTAAYTFPTAANTVMVFDAANIDDYGMYNTSTGVFTVPVAGWYRFTAQAQCGAQVAGSYLQLNFLSSGTTFAQDTMYIYGTGVYQTVRITDLLYFNAGSTLTIISRASTAVASVTGNQTNFATMEFVGSR